MNSNEYRTSIMHANKIAKNKKKDVLELGDLALSIAPMDPQGKTKSGVIRDLEMWYAETDLEANDIAYVTVEGYRVLASAYPPSTRQSHQGIGVLRILKNDPDRFEKIKGPKMKASEAEAIRSTAEGKTSKAIRTNVDELDLLDEMRRISGYIKTAIRRFDKNGIDANRSTRALSKLKGNVDALNGLEKKVIMSMKKVA